VTVQIAAVELRQLEIPLVEPLAAASGSTNTRTTILVRVIADGVEGWGECVAFTEPIYMADWSNGEYVLLSELFVPKLLDRRDIEAADVRQVLEGFKGHHTAKAALEMALLDVELKCRSQSLSSFLGGTENEVECAVVVSLLDGDALLRSVEHYLARGYRQFKLKIAPGHDVARIDLVQQRFPELQLRVDANGSYDWSNADHRSALLQMDERNLAFIEQPIAPGNARAFFQLREQIKTPIALDESVVSFARALDALDIMGCDAFALKPGLLGGYLTAKDLHDECLKRDVATMLGGMLETGVARAANLGLASLPGFCKHPAEIAPDGRWFHESLLHEPVQMAEGKIAVPTSPGIGADVDLAKVNRFTRRTHVAKSTATATDD
jgi:O-succinylbenzoate synthase